MRTKECTSCGSKDFYEENGYSICRYCGTKYKNTAEQYSDITLKKDVELLLKKCLDEPSRAKKYAQRILEIDPENKKAREYINEGQKGAGGCYIATAVYGSYDCPPVWTLRRFRDQCLAKTIWGRLFINVYYTISPFLVRMFGKTEWFIKIWRIILDKMVSDLQTKGYASEPYIEKRPLER